MPLTVVSEESAISAAIEKLDRILKNEAIPMDRRISHAGSRNKGTLPASWHAAHQFWGCVQTEDWSIEATEDKSRDRKYWIPFGTQDPTNYSSLKITVEVNPAKSGFDARCSGVVLTDGTNVFLGHLGKLGGLGKGAKIAFLKWSNAGEATLADGKVVPVIVIGNLSDSGFLKDLGRFVHGVDAFKKEFKPVA